MLDGIDIHRVSPADIYYRVSVYFLRPATQDRTTAFATALPVIAWLRRIRLNAHTYRLFSF